MKKITVYVKLTDKELNKLSNAYSDAVIHGIAQYRINKNTEVEIVKIAAKELK